ncbi:erythromycin esterase family protein [Ktedonosporobacter rubrisoli]|uniref:Erythromycin esterase family protein n=1 Tax=Ktedonosporobacter rubrisoli TaxID=2509675 RepID=A0A4P6K3J1_KTERU|nr:erythromycin esterase family protein [Ktedonosporobacter rubrisoli]QBD82532.1 erythromycin esterase family protein [Ktedonosporobacter rubrisoli]
MFKHAIKRRQLLARLAIGAGLLSINGWVASCGNGSSSAMTTEEHISSWIKQQAHPVKTTDPQAPIQDLTALRPLIGPASIVGLGEATHGSHELFTLKQRLIEFLVTSLGFTTLAWEMDWETGLWLNDYIHNGKGNPKDMLYFPLKAQEVLDTLEWLRAYNADPRHQQKVRCIGLDLAASSWLYTQVTQYVQNSFPKLYPTVEDAYSDFRSLTARNNISEYAQLPQNVREQYDRQAQSVVNLLQEHQTEFELHSLPTQFALALQHARVIAQYTRVQSKAGKDNFNAHDIAMADNATWAHQMYGKTIIWAHNSHIGKQTDVPQFYDHVMGEHLQQRFGKQYLAIGQSFNQGEMNAAVLTQGARPVVRTFTVPPARPSSYNALLGKTGYTTYLLDLRQAPEPAHTWLQNPHPYLDGPASLDPTQPIEKQIYGSSSWSQTFDLIMHTQQVTAAHTLGI